MPASKTGLQNNLLTRIESDPIVMARFVTKMVDMLQEFGVPENTIDVQIPGLSAGRRPGVDPGQVGVVVISKSDSDKNSSSIVIGFRSNDIAVNK